MSFIPNRSSSTQAKAIKAKFINALDNFKENNPEVITPEEYQAFKNLLNLIDFEQVINGENINKSLYQQYHGVDGYKDEALLYSEEEVENGASEAVGYSVDTLLALAAVLNNAELVQDMLNCGANLNEKDWVGNTPLHYAVIQENKEMISLLIEKGAKVDEQNNLGRTPLYLAVDWGEIEVIKTLLAFNPNLDLKDHYGRTARDLLKNIPEIEEHPLNLSAAKTVIDLEETDSTIQFDEQGTRLSGQVVEEE